MCGNVVVAVKNSLVNCKALERQVLKHAALDDCGAVRIYSHRGDTVMVLKPAVGDVHRRLFVLGVNLKKRAGRWLYGVITTEVSSGISPRLVTDLVIPAATIKNNIFEGHCHCRRA